MRVVAILAAAGSGSRLGLKTRKPFVLLAGKPLVSYALGALDASGSIDGIIVAGEEKLLPRFRALVKKYRFKKVIGVVAGGATRSASVRNALARVPEGCRIVLIQDGGRPFLEDAMIRDSVACARRYGACVVAVPSNDTVKLVDRKKNVERTLERGSLYRAQTPQVFRREVIEKAYRRKDLERATDDAMLVEMGGGRVKVLEGSYRNIKVTTREDLKLAEVLLCG